MVSRATQSRLLRSDVRWKGSVCSTGINDSLGVQAASTGSGTNWFRYTGREFDTETNYYRARYYDPSAGRFTSEDPINFDGGINFYSYALNDPVLFNDPMGLSATGQCLKACLKIYYGLTRDAGVVLGISAPIIPKAFALAIGNLASRTPIAGAALARWLPVAGLALTAIDAYGIQDCTRQCLRDNWFPCSSN